VLGSQFIPQTIAALVYIIVSVRPATYGWGIADDAGAAAMVIIATSQ
jgi:hypothetical protein